MGEGKERFLSVEKDENAVDKHIKMILEKVKLEKEIKVVLDCASGAGAVITPKALKKMGCNVKVINGETDGKFRRAIKPKEKNLSELIDMVKRLGADFGIAHDGDADRMMAVCENGWFVEGDLLFCMFVKNENASKVVTTLDVSMVIDEHFDEVIRTPIGDSYVSQELGKSGGGFGGEASGSWVFPGVSLCADEVLAAAKIAEIASKTKLSKLLDGIKVPH